MSAKPATVLIVDDTLENLRVLGEMLELDGHEVRIASQGAQCLEMVHQSPPDLILLDVMMPGMDGHEVCRRLKADPATSEIPIIFLTAMNDEADEAQGLDLGAVDYITKPFKMNLVRKRIGNHLNLHRLQRALHEANESLELQVAARTEELVEAHHQLVALDKTKTQFLSLLIQEVQAPANGILGIGQLALLTLDDPEKKQRLQTLFDSIRDRFEKILAQYQRLVAFQESQTAIRLTPVRLEETLEAAWAPLAPAFPHSILKTEAADHSFMVMADQALLVEALAPLLMLLAEVSGAVLEARFEENQGVALIVRAATDLDLPPNFPFFRDGKPAGWTLVLSNLILTALGAEVSLVGGPGPCWELIVEFSHRSTAGRG